MNYTNTMYHYIYDKRRLATIAMHDTQRTKTKVTTFTPPLFVCHATKLCIMIIIFTLSFHIAFNIAPLEFLKALANYNSMKMLGAFPVASYGELGRYPLFKD